VRGPSPQPSAPAEQPEPRPTGHAAGFLRERRRWLTAALQDPLLRNGHTLTLSGVITGVVGLAYWSVAARRYSTAAVGEGSAAVSALMLLAGVAQFNLMSMLMRFVPTQGARGRRLVLAAYAVSVVTAGVLATGFVLFAGHLSPGLAFFSSSGALEVAFVAATVLGTVSVLQDAALTAVRRPGWVVTENAVMAVAKIVLVAALATALPETGIVVSWAGAILAGVVVANIYLFRRPLRRGRVDTPTEQVSSRDLLRYVAPDYAGELLWLAATSGIPLVVVAKIGTTDFAYFGVAWTVTFMLGQATSNLGYSMIVECASRPEAVGEMWLRVIRHVTPLLAAAVAVLVVAAPWVLLPFGPDYASHGATVFRLLALSTLPGLVTSTVVNATRVQRKTGVGLVVLAALCGGVIVGSIALLPALGADAVGVAWLVAQTVVAAAALVLRRHWLPGGSFDLRPSSRHALGLPRRLGPATQHTGALSHELVAGLHLPFSDAAPGQLVLDLRSRNTDFVMLGVKLRDEPVALLKRPLTPRGSDVLRREHETLTELHAALGSHHCDRLLPRSQWMHDDDGRGYVVQEWMAGASGALTASSHPREASRLLSAALTGLDDLHHAVGSPQVADSSLVERWLEPRIDLLGQLGSNGPGRRRLARVGHLRTVLAERMTGCTVLTGYAHNDLWLAKTLFAERGELCAIVDWTHSAPGEPLAVDACTLGLTTWAAITGRSVGEVTARALRAGGWRTLLRGHLGLTRQALTRPDDLDETTTLLLSWLQHVAANLGASQRYRDNPLWVHDNVDRVLAEVTARTSFSRPTGGWRDDSARTPAGPERGQLAHATPSP
jgi:O-antigen/teichoic acid export membrane protein